MHGGAAARRLDGALDEPSRRLAARGEACVRAYDAWEQQRLRHGYWDEARLARLSAQLDPQTLLLPPRATPEAPRVALLISGQAYRGRAREAASYSTHTLREPIASRRRAQALAAASLMAKVVLPFEAAGHHVDLFLTLYNTLLPSHREELLSFYRGRVKAITTVRERGSSQLVTLAQSLKTFLDLCAANHLHYEAVIVTRFDLYLKQSIPALLGGDARAVDGFRFLWRESSGHWRHSARGRALTFRSGRPGFDWRLHVVRVPDTLIAFPFAYTDCFRRAVRFETLPKADTPNTTSLIGFLHGIIRTLRSAVLSRLESDPPGIRFMLNNFSGDSNPCRATCMLNPVYEILPRADWIVSSNICQQSTDFSYDNISRSLCCPSPNYCCPNSISNCFDAKAVLFDVFKSGTPRQVIAKSWPRYQIEPYSWHLTPASRRYVVEVWRNESRAYRESIDSSCTLVRVRQQACTKRDMSAVSDARDLDAAADRLESGQAHAPSKPTRLSARSRRDTL